MYPQRPVTFTNSAGQRLVGILHEPEAGSARDVGILLLSPGVKNRVAPHRLYNKMAEAYVALGFPVLRFDFYGLGDAEGCLDEAMLADVYQAIQLGRYVDDTRSAMAWMEQHSGTRRFVLGGLCGGAITGVLAGAGDPRVAGILGLGLPVMLDGSKVDKVKQMTTGQLAGMRQRYVRKLLNPSAWLRVLTLKSDFRLAFRALSTPRSAPKPTPPAASAPAPAAGSNANPLFPPAFLRLLGDGRPVLLLFSGADRLLAEFEEKFLQYHRSEVDERRGSFDLLIVENANHVFTFTEWQHEMLHRTRAWLQQRFPAAAVAAPQRLERAVPLVP